MRDLGREPQDKYFYFDGFGGGGGKKKGSTDATASSEPAAPAAVDVKLVGFDAKAKIKVIKGKDNTDSYVFESIAHLSELLQRYGPCWGWV